MLSNSKVLQLFTAAATLLVMSCQKDFVVEDDIDVPVVTGDSNYLSKVYHVLSNGMVNDTFITQSYQYDNSKRVTSIVVIDQPSVLHPNITNASKQEWFFNYNGSAMLPYKTSFMLNSVAPSSSSSDTLNTFHFFNAAEIKLKDSAVYETRSTTAATGLFHSVERLVSSYSYSGNKRYGISNSTTSYIFPSQPDFSYSLRDTVVTDTRGNAVSFIQYEMGSGQPINEEQYTYESSVSPMAKLNVNKALSLTSVDTTIYPVAQTYNNRAKTQWATFIPAIPYQSQDLAGKYLLNAAGFPSQINMGPNRDFPNLYYRVYFIYRHF
ncbi:MAG: hypothetical protein EOO06_19185 [Chitinophagaceae bacterium]|nr:MAG: hypothetical protein EOO06_19185 [Chitinophagaceae bacterium]